MNLGFPSGAGRRRLPLKRLVSLCSAAVAFAGIAGAQSPSSFLSKPDVHGDNIVFTAEGDLWLGSLKANTARRLTTAPGVESNAHFSPDGSMIAFTGQYQGGNNIYVMPTEGGAPKRLTYGLGDACLGWTPDGKSILYSSVDPVHYVWKLYTVPVGGGEPTELPVPQGQYASYLNANELVYVPVTNYWMNWYRYHAGRNDQIWTTNLVTHQFKRITHDDLIETAPIVCDGKVYGVTEVNGTRNLGELNMQTGKFTVITHYVDTPVEFPSTDGKRIIFQVGPGLAMYDPAIGKVSPVNPEMNSDFIHERPELVPVAGHIQSLGVGPTGKRVVAEVEGQIVTMPVKEGAFMVIDNTPGSRSSLPAWSPDGKQIAFVSDRTGENEVYIRDANDPTAVAKRLSPGTIGEFFQPIWSPDGKSIVIEDRTQKITLIDVATGKATVLDNPQRTGSYDGTTVAMSFSPDSKYLAFQRTGPNLLSQIELYEVATGKHQVISYKDVNSYEPTFTTDGKYLAYLADRDLTPLQSGYQFSFDKVTRVNLVALSAATTSPFEVKNDEEGAPAPKPPVAPPKPGTVPTTKVDWDGLQERTQDLGIPTDRYSLLSAADGELLVWTQTEDRGPAGNLMAWDFATKKLRPFAAGVTGFSVTANGQAVMLQHGPMIQVVPAALPEAPPTMGVVALNSAVKTEPKEVWKAAFEEGWRVARDFYYDPNMHGVNWMAVKKKYEAELPMVGDRSDLTTILAAMLSELSTGHCYVGSPPAGGINPAAIYGAIGFLGVKTAPATNGVKIVKIYQTDHFDLQSASPLAAPGIDAKVGDIITAINGEPLGSNEPIEQALEGQAGKVVTVTLQGADGKSRTVTVKTISLGQENALRNEDWVMKKTAYVKAHGGANIGYVYVPDMESAGFKGFYEGQIPNVYKSGMIYDIRFNGGGLISGMILDTIRSHVFGYFHPRDGFDWNRWGWAAIGHKVALCNEYCFSDAEYFSHMFKQMKLGKLIGHRTGGGEVGSGGGYHLIDNGTIYVPNYGAYVGDRWIVEGTGVTPDIQVDQDPAAVLRGEDPQLDAAIEELKKENKADPVVKPTHPPFPVTAVKGVSP